jgi:hypothetical protein
MTILTDAEGIRYSYDNLRTQGRLDGHASGLDAAVEFLQEHSVKLFRAGKDDEATRLRRFAEEMAKELRPGMEKRAREHAKDHPIVLGAEEDDRSSTEKLKFGSLKRGEHFICWPVPGDGHGGYLGPQRLFVKTGELTADSGGRESSMNTKMDVIKIRVVVEF